MLYRYPIILKACVLIRAGKFPFLHTLADLKYSLSECNADDYLIGTLSQSPIPMFAVQELTIELGQSRLAITRLRQQEMEIQAAVQAQSSKQSAEM